MTLVEIIAIILGSLGIIFLLISFLGIITFPNFIVRLHAQGVGDTLGLLFILLAMAVCTGLKIITVKYLLIFIVTMITNPLGTSILLQAFSHNGEIQNELDADDSKKGE